MCMVMVANEIDEAVDVRPGELEKRTQQLDTTILSSQCQLVYPQHTEWQMWKCRDYAYNTINGREEMNDIGGSQSP